MALDHSVFQNIMVAMNNKVEGIKVPNCASEKSKDRGWLWWYKVCKWAGLTHGKHLADKIDDEGIDQHRKFYHGITLGLFFNACNDDYINHPLTSLVMKIRPMRR